MQAVLQELAVIAESGDEGARGACVIGELEAWKGEEGPQVLVKGELV